MKRSHGDRADNGPSQDEIQCKYGFLSSTAGLICLPVASFMIFAYASHSLAEALPQNRVRLSSHIFSPALGSHILRPLYRTRAPRYVFVYPSCDSCSLRRPSDHCLRSLSRNPGVTLVIPDRDAEQDFTRTVGQSVRATVISAQRATRLCNILGDASLLARIDQNGDLCQAWTSKEDVERQCELLVAQNPALQ